MGLLLVFAAGYVMGSRGGGEGSTMWSTRCMRSANPKSSTTS